MSPSNSMPCLIAVRSLYIFLRFIQFFQLGCINENCMRFILVSVLSRIATVCKAFISRPYVV